MASRPDEQMISEKVAPVLVARTLGPFDLVVIFVAIVLFINNSAGVQFAGPSVFIFWIVAFLTFLITGAFVTAQLGRMFPEEGSLYVWTHKVLGPFWGFFAGFVAWWPGPISLVFIGILFANYLQQAAVLIKPSCDYPCIFTENWQIGVVVLGVIWFSALMSYLKMRVTQNYVNVLFWFYAAAIFLIGFAGVWWLLQGNGASTDFGTGWNPLQGDELALGVPANLTFFSFAILALLGIETPLNMGAEVTGGEKAIRTFLLVGVRGRDRRVPVDDLGEHGRDRGRRCERDHRGGGVRGGLRSGDGPAPRSRSCWRGSCSPSRSSTTSPSDGCSSCRGWRSACRGRSDA